MFGSIQEDLQQCIWHALDSGCSETVATIAFWLDGFSAENGKVLTAVIKGSCLILCSILIQSLQVVWWSLFASCCNKLET